MVRNHYSFKKIMTGSDLSRRRLPVMCATSGNPGPVVWLTACSHGDEVLDNGQRHIGVEQGHPDVTDGLVDVGFAQAPLAAQVLERRGKAVREAGKHRRSLLGGRAGHPGHQSSQDMRPRQRGYLLLTQPGDRQHH